MNKEIWKDVIEYEGLYQVSNFGNVKSLNYNRSGKEKLLKPGIGTTGYYNVFLSKNGKKKTFKVHQLVAICFLNHKPNGFNLVVNHIDNNPLNNHVSNLELVNQRYNSSCHKKDVGITKLKSGKYQVNIEINYKSIHLGWFSNKDNALIVYNNAVKNVYLFDGNTAKFRKLCNKDAKNPDLIGLKLDKKTNKYDVRICINYQAVYLGRFLKEKALQMYQRAKDNTHLYKGDNKAFRDTLMMLG
jgi:hypothetical protein